MPSFYPGQKANELAKEAQKRFESAVEDLKREEAATNRLAEEYGQLQLNAIRSTIKRFVTFLENTGRKASESEKRLLEGMDFSVQQMKEYKAAALEGKNNILWVALNLLEQPQQVTAVLLVLLLH